MDEWLKDRSRVEARIADAVHEHGIDRCHARHVARTVYNELVLLSEEHEFERAVEAIYTDIGGEA